jgi:hypothetical protein
MEGLRHPLTQENKTIGEAVAHKHIHGSLLERRIKRAIYCVENDVDQSFIDWFVADTGMQPQEFIDKWCEKLNVN